MQKEVLTHILMTCYNAPKEAITTLLSIIDAIDQERGSNGRLEGKATKLEGCV